MWLCDRVQNVKKHAQSSWHQEVLFRTPFLPLSLQAILRANSVEYGLCACVWSENSGTTHRVAQAMDVSLPDK